MARRPRGGAKKTIVVGDVHGCIHELETLLDRVEHRPGDRLVFVGDLLARGPDSLAVIALARRLDAKVVRGNHEERVLRALGKGYTTGGGPPAEHHRALADSLSEGDAELLERTPLYVVLPEHDLTVVHAGLEPDLPLDAQTAETLLHVRSVKRDGKKSLWGAAYEGPNHVVFGHNAIEKLQLHPFATGLDTGCVYGGALTALVLHEGETVPASFEERREKLVSVPAERVWFDPHAKD